ncbi:SPOR domain-containing protein [Epibacterium sp. SM1979]|uniref:SPOR domain-containing protein n=1 Tax=Tritonibacter litoralis TaxID=2662264 RepID=A0A843YKN0_9RHOB|nr:SPOR domain-containing protein [Tritonibacter litoralis]MQQ09964.1 SPOR domain-containing protein [Tritonibacter litoralis]
MKLTRIIALAIIAGGAFGQDARAQQFRTASPPAELPPSSYQGRQYVDSRGCVYIRAGIDGIVNWVPRVQRNRRQICGFQPTDLAGTAAAPAPARRASAAPELITLPEADRPNATQAAPTAAAAPTVQAAAPTVPATTRKVVAPQKPQRRAPTPVVAAPAPKPDPTPAPQVKRVRRVEAAPLVIQPAPTAKATVRDSACDGLSEVSRQYTNSTGVRCGPQSQSPVSFGPQSSLQLPADTRVLPAHLYSDRQQAAGITPPPGYRTVWEDDRLNPRRAEQDLFPRAAVSEDTPEGFTRVADSLPRFNPNRGVRTAAGDAQTAQVWTDTLPRKLVAKQPARTITVENRSQHTPAQLGFLSSDVSAELAQPLRYVRAASFADPAQAKAAAGRLAASGLPVRMGRASRQGKELKVVLVGPVRGAAAQAALGSVQQAGFPAARLSK